MAYEQKPNTGALFPNDKRTKEESPQYTGKCNIECPHCKEVQMLYIAGWDSQSKPRDDGGASKYFTSLKFNVPQERKDAAPLDAAPRMGQRATNAPQAPPVDAFTDPTEPLPTEPPLAEGDDDLPY
jgi:hypothetical protein